MIDTLGRAKIPHDVFIDLDSAIEIAVRSKKPKAVALVKWLTKKGVEKIQEDHQQAITGRDNQIQALEFMNEEHQHEILRLNEEINDLIVNRHVATTCFVSSKRTAEKFTHTMLFDVRIGSWKDISLDFVTQTWRWLTNVTIQMQFTDGVDLSVK